MTRSVPAVAVAAAAVALAAAACGESPLAVPACRGDADCESGRCAGGRCVSPDAGPGDDDDGPRDDDDDRRDDGGDRRDAGPDAGDAAFADAGTPDAGDGGGDAGPPRALGAACGRDGQCQSGFCADGVCCAEACQARCEVCGADGVCADVPEGEDPDGECAEDGCHGGACDGAGRCGRLPEGTPCAPPACDADGLTLREAACDPGGECVAGTTSCSPALCRDGACIDRCGSDADCATGVCDLRGATCAATVRQVDCGADPSALQEAIDDDAPGGCAGGPCVLRVTGECGAIVVERREDVYLAGAAGARIRPATPGAAVSVRGDTGPVALTLAGMTVTGAMGTGGHGVSCNGAAARVALLRSAMSGNAGAGVASSECALRIDATRLQENTRGALRAFGGTLDMTNSVALASGLLAGTSGVRMDGLEPGSRFLHNTVADSGRDAAGVLCTGATPLVRDSIVIGSGGADLDGCAASDSHVGDDPAMQVCPGDPGLTADGHLSPGSACIDAVGADGAGACGGLAHDLDGEARPRGEGCDVGADEAG